MAICPRPGRLVWFGLVCSLARWLLTPLCVETRRAGHFVPISTRIPTPKSAHKPEASPTFPTVQDICDPLEGLASQSAAYATAVICLAYGEVRRPYYPASLPPVCAYNLFFHVSLSFSFQARRINCLAYIVPN